MEEYEWRSTSGKSTPKRRRNIEQLTKSYVDLVAEAISSSQTKTMTVGDICAYLKTRYGSGKSETTLKNTVRHTLSCYSIFKKIRKEEYNRPALWTVRQEEFVTCGSRQGEPDPDTPSTSSATPGQHAATQTASTTFEEHSKSVPASPATLSRAISVSCPVSLMEDPDSADFLEPSAARYSIPVELDQMR